MNFWEEVKARRDARRMCMLPALGIACSKTKKWQC